ncbi:MAG: heavy-metal-associated domain-containing protein, partial [Phycisphaerales bacterium]|nr:heavy-metal-associated domain-containing protein [Phycisphaerales bacterium]
VAGCREAAQEASAKDAGVPVKTVSATATPVVLEFEVTPMTCQGCVSSITELVSKLPGVSSVDVTLETKHATVSCDSEERATEIIAALKDNLREAVLIAQHDAD